MEPQKLKELLSKVQNGQLEVGQAMERLKTLPFEDLGFAMVDHHRQLRNGVPEVIYGAGKSIEQVAAIAQSMYRAGTGCILVTRIGPEICDALESTGLSADYQAQARIALIGKACAPLHTKPILIIAGGTSDLPVAKEAAFTAQAFGNHVRELYDVGVAGLHRLLSHIDLIRSANVIVAVAGMEGALPSVIGGLVDKPVIAVPTSVGYGASFGGVSALLTMLNSCASGIAVVNIDNGFGAAYLASMINRMASQSNC